MCLVGWPFWVSHNFSSAAHLLVLVSVMLLNVLRCWLSYQGQAETNTEAWFNIALRPHGNQKAH